MHCPSLELIFFICDMGLFPAPASFIIWDEIMIESIY